MSSPSSDNFFFLRNGSTAPVVPDIVHEFIAFWRARQQESGNRLPAKSQFSIQAMRPFLAGYYVAEWTGDDLFNRLIGMEIDRGIGESVTGQSFLERFSGDQRTYFRTFWPQLLEVPCGVISARVRHCPNGRSKRIEGVAMPLADESGKARFFCGVGAVTSVFTSDALGGDEAVTMEYLSYVDVGFGIPTSPPDPHGFNRASGLMVEAK